MDDGDADEAPDADPGAEAGAAPEPSAKHLFLFRCRDCGRVAEEGRWVLHDNTPTVRATHIRAYPSPECPSCGSRDIDMDHGLKYVAADDPEPDPWTGFEDHQGRGSG